MRCTMTGEPYTVFGYGGKQVRDNIHAPTSSRRSRRSTPRRAPARGLQHRRRPRAQLLDARGDRALRGRSPGASSTGRSPSEHRDRRPPLVDQRPRAVQARLPGLGASRYGIDDILREIHEHNAERWAGGAMKLSVVIPAHNEVGLDRRDASSAIAAALEAAADRLRDRRRRRRAAATARRRRARARPSATRACAACARRCRPASASPCAPGSSSFSGDAVAIMMADGSDSPEDLVAYYRAARGRLRLRVRLALHAAAATRARLPAARS